MFILSWSAVNSRLNTSTAEGLEDKIQLGEDIASDWGFIYSWLVVNSWLIMGNSLPQGLLMIGLSVGPSLDWAM